MKSYEKASKENPLKFSHPKWSFKYIIRRVKCIYSKFIFWKTNEVIKKKKKNWRKGAMTSAYKNRNIVFL